MQLYGLEAFYKAYLGRYSNLPDGMTAGEAFHKAWFWCRKHGRPEKGSWHTINGLEHCILVGPFMAEGEALHAGEGLITYERRQRNSM